MFEILLAIFALISLVPSLSFGVHFVVYGDGDLEVAMGILFLAIAFFILKAFLDFLTKDDKR